MIDYIKQLLGELDSSLPKESATYASSVVLALINTSSTELERLDPRDFVPSVQASFARDRALLKRWTAYDPTAGQFAAPKVRSLCKELLKALDSYGGEGSHVKSRSFAFISDDELRNIIDRDYRELRVFLFPAGAWKSVVIMAGSILEAILNDALTRDGYQITTANKSAKAPGGKKGEIEKGKWDLSDLIKVATDIGVLPEPRARTVDQVLRDYRNFVHPKKEIRSKHQIREAEAYLAIGALDGVCDHLE